MSRSTRRSPLTRQPVLTHEHRRHVVIGKSTSFPLHDIVSDAAPPPRTNTSDTRGRHRHSTSHSDTRCHTVTSHGDRAACDSDSGDESDDDDDDDDDALWLENTRPSATETAQQTDAIFVPGRLLGTSDSFCIGPRPMSGDERGRTSAADGDVSSSQHAADSGGRDNNASHTDSQPDTTLADNDTFDDITSSSSPAFVRETRIRRRPNIRRQRVTSDHASD